MIGGIALAVVLIAAIMIAEGVSGMKKKKTDVSEGLKIIEQAESADVTAIETKIGQLEAQRFPGAGRYEKPEGDFRQYSRDG